MCDYNSDRDTKISEGQYRFLCPHCGDMLATVNPRNNLAHCFNCQKNLNNIDLLITLGYDFKSAVIVLERLLERHEARLPKKENADPEISWCLSVSPGRSHHTAIDVANRPNPSCPASPKFSTIR